jgi:hypothetical protein
MNRNGVYYVILGGSIAAIVLVTVMWMFSSGGNTTPAEEKTEGPIQPRIREVTAAEVTEHPAGPPAQPVLSPQEEAQKDIDTYRKKIDADPKSEDAPPLQLAMGNLYLTKLLDYEKAAETYEWYIQQYADAHPADLRTAFVQLATCYERLGEKHANEADNKYPEKLNRLYMDMMKRYPEDSQEYLFAKAKLNL